MKWKTKSQLGCSLYLLGWSTEKWKLLFSNVPIQDFVQLCPWKSQAGFDGSFYVSAGFYCGVPRYLIIQILGVSPTKVWTSWMSGFIWVESVIPPIRSLEKIKISIKDDLLSLFQCLQGKKPSFCLLFIYWRYSPGVRNKPQSTTNPSGSFIKGERWPLVGLPERMCGEGQMELVESALMVHLAHSYMGLT